MSFYGRDKNGGRTPTNRERETRGASWSKGNSSLLGQGEEGMPAIMSQNDLVSDLRSRVTTLEQQVRLLKHQNRLFVEFMQTAEYQLDQLSRKRGGSALHASPNNSNASPTGLRAYGDASRGYGRAQATHSAPGGLRRGQQARGNKDYGQRNSLAAAAASPASSPSMISGERGEREGVPTYSPRFAGRSSRQVSTSSRAEPPGGPRVGFEEDLESERLRSTKRREIQRLNQLKKSQRHTRSAHAPKKPTPPSPTVRPKTHQQSKPRNGNEHSEYDQLDPSPTTSEREPWGNNSANINKERERPKDRLRAREREESGGREQRTGMNDRGNGGYAAMQGFEPRQELSREQPLPKGGYAEQAERERERERESGNKTRTRDVHRDRDRDPGREKQWEEPAAFSDQDSKQAEESQPPPQSFDPQLDGIPDAFAPPPPRKPCPHCDRKFPEAALIRHIEKKVCLKKRRAFNSAAARQTKEAEEVARQSSRGHASRKNTTAMKGARKKDWRSERQQFLDAIRAGKAISKALANGVDPRDLPPPPASTAPDDRVQCPHCTRRFAAATAERHIPHCATQRSRPKPPTRRAANRR